MERAEEVPPPPIGDPRPEEGTSGAAAAEAVLKALGIQSETYSDWEEFSLGEADEHQGEAEAEKAAAAAEASSDPEGVRAAASPDVHVEEARASDAASNDVVDEEQPQAKEDSPAAVTAAPSWEELSLNFSFASAIAGRHQAHEDEGFEYPDSEEDTDIEERVAAKKKRRWWIIAAIALAVLAVLVIAIPLGVTSGGKDGDPKHSDEEAVVGEGADGPDVPSASPSQSEVLATSGPTTPAPVPASINGDVVQECRYYNKWVDSTCQADCLETEPLPNLYATLDDCCSAEFIWEGAYATCMGITNPPSSADLITATPSTGPTNVPSTISMPPTMSSPTTAKPSTIEPTGKPSPEQTQSPQPCFYYNMWLNSTCQSYCLETDSLVMYATLDECCLSEYTWSGAYEICMGMTSPPTGGPTAAEPFTVEPVPPWNAPPGSRYVFGFESGRLDTYPEWTTSGNGRWQVSSERAAGGKFSLRAPYFDNPEKAPTSSNLTLTIGTDFDAGHLHFSVLGGTALPWDTVDLIVNGKTWGGKWLETMTEFRTAKLLLWPMGKHVITWRYRSNPHMLGAQNFPPDGLVDRAGFFIDNVYVAESVSPI